MGRILVSAVFQHVRYCTKCGIVARVESQKPSNFTHDKNKLSFTSNRDQIGIKFRHYYTQIDGTNDICYIIRL